MSYDLSVVRICEVRCSTCIFTPDSPISSQRRQEYEQMWQDKDTFQICHHGTVTGDPALMCRGFYDYCLTVSWFPLILQLGQRLDRIRFVPPPEVPNG